MLLFVAHLGDIDDRVDRFADIVFDLRFERFSVQCIGREEAFDDFLTVGSGKFIEDFVCEDPVLFVFIKYRQRKIFEDIVDNLFFVGMAALQSTEHNIDSWYLAGILKHNAYNRLI